MPFVSSVRASYGAQRKFRSVSGYTENTYFFNTATFTTGSQTGRTGPNVTQARSGLGNPSWASTYLNMTTNGIQRWTVPESGPYRIRAAGANGGGTGNYSGGRGIIVESVVDLFAQEILLICVGQGGRPNSSTICDAGGGGGTFVVRSTQTPLVCAGGGGGAGGNQNKNGNDAVFTNTGGTATGSYTGAGGTNGNGGQGGGRGASGAGLLGDGSVHNWGNVGGSDVIARAFINGATGGSSTAISPNVEGGFGGGASGHGGCYIGSGGGGGYSGGGSAASSDQTGHGGGGGSFLSGIQQLDIGFQSYSGNATAGADGYVIITFVG